MAKTLPANTSEPRARMQFSYETLDMPLSVAHQIQTLLTQAETVTSTYTGGQSIYYLRDYTPPTVGIAKDKGVLHDARALSETQLEAWLDDAKRAVESGYKADDVMAPAEWAKLKGEA